MAVKNFKKFAQGILIVRAQNSSFNSDFSGLPRRLPDDNGTIYATDKALKYCVRRYLYDKGEKIFVWRRYEKDGKPCNIDENYKQVFKTTPSDNKQKVSVNLSSALDVRLFGATYAGQTNVSLTGTTQISYGINKFNDNLFFNSQILSPYADHKAGDKGKVPKQQTLGNETKTLEAHYVYDFVINPNNLINSIVQDKEKNKESLLQESDMELFKEAMCRGVSYTTSASKIGSDAELFIFVEMNSKEKNERIESHILPTMKDHVIITKKNGKNVIDLTKLFTTFTKNYKKYIAGVELYYDPNIVELNGIEKYPVKKKHIVTLEEIH